VKTIEKIVYSDTIIGKYTGALIEGREINNDLEFIELEKARLALSAYHHYRTDHS
jgi:hypothetical protein